MPGPREATVVSGSEVACLGGQIPPIGVPASIGVASHNKIIKVIITMDYAVMKDPQIFADTLYSNINELIASV